MGLQLNYPRGRINDDDDEMGIFLFASISSPRCLVSIIQRTAHSFMLVDTPCLVLMSYYIRWKIG
jgi:hypothetical protein